MGHLADFGRQLVCGCRMPFASSIGSRLHLTILGPGRQIAKPGSLNPHFRALCLEAGRNTQSEPRLETGE